MFLAVGVVQVYASLCKIYIMAVDQIVAEIW